MDFDQIFSVNFKPDVALNPLDCLGFVSSPKCGAINLFAGTIRDSDIWAGHGAKTHNEPISGIHYEAYESMARKQIEQILLNALGSTNDNGLYELTDVNSRARVDIRLGRVPVGEVSIIICASSKSRQLSHEATMSILNNIKARVVIWKKIIYADGVEQWDGDEKSEASWLNGG